MLLPTVLSIAPGSAAEAAGLLAGDQIKSIGGTSPRDIIEYQLLVDNAAFELEVDRGGIELQLSVAKHTGDPLGAEISDAIFDRVRTCDNHCEFCFIYQLPKGMRRSLYLKDDDYRLSFLYGNFTTLTRFTEADLERVITEHLSPLFVSIHTTNAPLRAKILRNQRGALSLRWLKALLEAGIEIHGQIVLCPGVNDGAELVRTLADIAISYPKIASVGVVPLGISKFQSETDMRIMTRDEARESLEVIATFQEIFHEARGERVVGASDEMYLLAELPFPGLERYDGFPQHENGIGMARAFEAAFFGDEEYAWGRRAGFFSSVDGAPALGYRAPRVVCSTHEQPGAALKILTAPLGARVIEPIVASTAFSGVDVVTVENQFFGGNIGVSGLMTGEDIERTLRTLDAPSETLFLLPDVCLNNGIFLDGKSPADLDARIEVIPTDGLSLRRALEKFAVTPV